MGGQVSHNDHDGSPPPSLSSSSDDTPADQLYFPPEILTKIVARLTPRDKLIARQVCYDWNEFVTFGSSVKSEVVVTIEESENNLIALRNSPLPCIWTEYALENLDLSKRSV